MSYNPPFSLDEEIMDEWLVTSEQKRIWQIELQMTKEILRVCNLHGIRIFASCGTLLGAIRHHGFIPWDNDMDFFMLRKDYEELLRHADEFNEPYFVQTVKSENGKWYRGFARIVDCNTTCITPMDKNIKGSHKGIYIDLFPLDKVPDENFKLKKKLLEYELRVARNLCFIKVYGGYRYNTRNKFIQILAWVLKYCLFFISVDTLDSLHQRICKKYNNTNFKGYHVLSFGYGKGDRYHYTLTESDFVPTEMHVFENIEIPIPQNYSSHLVKIYGKTYMEFPPMAKRSFHYDNSMNPDIPYTTLEK